MQEPGHHDGRRPACRCRAPVPSPSGVSHCARLGPMRPVWPYAGGATNTFPSSSTATASISSMWSRHQSRNGPKTSSTSRGTLMSTAFNALRTASRSWSVTAASRCTSGVMQRKRRRAGFPIFLFRVWLFPQSGHRVESRRRKCRLRLSAAGTYLLVDPPRSATPPGRFGGRGGTFTLAPPLTAQLPQARFRTSRQPGLRSSYGGQGALGGGRVARSG
jgi:hypothetical protein